MVEPTPLKNLCQNGIILPNFQSENSKKIFELPPTRYSQNWIHLPQVSVWKFIKKSFSTFISFRFPKPKAVFFPKANRFACKSLGRLNLAPVTKIIQTLKSSKVLSCIHSRCMICMILANSVSTLVVFTSYGPIWLRDRYTNLIVHGSLKKTFLLVSLSQNPMYYCILSKDL